MNEDGPVRVLCIDDHPLILMGVKAMLESEPDMLFAGGASAGEDGVRLFRELRPDVALVDLRLKEMNGIATIAAIRGQWPEARLIALTAYKGDEDIRRALAAGARGYLLKDLMHKDLVTAIRRVHSGARWIAPEAAATLAESLPGTDLTPRELEVLKLVAEGNRNREAAGKLRISEETVRFHLKSIFGKLGVNGRALAVTAALKRGILHLD